MSTEDPVAPRRSNFLRAITRFKYLILALAVAFPLISLAYDSQQTKLYSATTQMKLNSQNRTDSGAIVPLNAADIATAQQVAMSKEVEDIVASRTHTNPPPVEVTQAGLANSLNFTVTSKSPAGAALYANAYAKAYLDYSKLAYTQSNLAQQQVLEKKKAEIDSTIRDLEAQLATATANKSPNVTALNAQLQAASAEIQVVTNSQTSLSVALAEVSNAGTVTSPATVPTSPSSPKIATDALAAIVFGLLLAVVIAIALSFIDDRIRDSATLKELVEPIPIIGEVPLFRSPDQSSRRRRRKAKPLPVISSAEPHSQAAEAYRSLRTAVQFLGVDAPGSRVIQVTSPGTDEGKTTTTVNLAALMSQVGRTVVLVSADLRRPATDRFFELPKDKGLSTVLAGTSTLDESITPIGGFPGLSVIAAGPVPPNPSELVGSREMAQLVGQLRERFDMVLIDTAPLLPVPDAVDLSKHADAVVLIIRCGSTRGRDVIKAMERLSSAETSPSGVVFNFVPNPTAFERYLYRHGYGSYGYRGYSGYSGYGGYSSYAPLPSSEAGDSSSRA